MTVSAILGRQLPESGNLRILTHNIYGQNAGWNARRRVLHRGIRQLRPDLVAFQEVILTDAYDQAADVLGSDYQIVNSREREANGSGVAIASRWPVRIVDELDLHLTPRTGDFACTTLIAEVTAPEPLGPLLVVNHFPDYQPDHEHERELQTVVAARAIEEIRSRREVHVVLAGDLDAESDAASTRFLAGKQSLGGMSVCYRNAWDSAHPEEAGHTFSRRNPLNTAMNWDWPFQRIDHIFVRCGQHGGPTLAIAACELAFAEPIDGVWASDHFGLVADLVPPPLPRLP